MLREIDYGRGDRSLALIVADQGLHATDAAQAITLAGGAFRRKVEWHAAKDGRFDHPGAIEMVALETQGVAVDMLATALPRIAELRDSTDVRIVVALETDQIDIIAAMLFGERVEMLCEPTVADRAAAFAVGLTAFPRDKVHDNRSGTESAQLRRLNEEVARISRVLAKLSSAETRSGGVTDRQNPFGLPPVADEPCLTNAADVRKIIRGRRLRDQFFGEGLFEDPAWDMLLDLYAAKLEGAQVSVSSLCIAAAVAPTTALRWIARMTEAELFVRQPDPFDRRRAFLTLSDEARQKIDRYFAALRQGGLDAL